METPSAWALRNGYKRNASSKTPRRSVSKSYHHFPTDERRKKRTSMLRDETENAQFHSNDFNKNRQDRQRQRLVISDDSDDCEHFEQNNRYRYDNEEEEFSIRQQRKDDAKRFQSDEEFVSENEMDAVKRDEEKRNKRQKMDYVQDLQDCEHDRKTTFEETIKNSMSCGVLDLYKVGKKLHLLEEQGRKVPSDVMEHVTKKFNKKLVGTSVGIDTTNATVHDLILIAKGQSVFNFFTCSEIRRTEENSKMIKECNKEQLHLYLADPSKTYPSPGKECDLGGFNINLPTLNAWEPPKTKAADRQLYYFLSFVLQEGYHADNLKNLTYRSGEHGGRRGKHLVLMKADAVNYIKELTWVTFGFDSELLTLGNEDPRLLSSDFFSSIDGGFDEKLKKLRELRRLKLSWEKDIFDKTLKRALNDIRAVASRKEKPDDNDNRED